MSKHWRKGDAEGENEKMFNNFFLFTLTATATITTITTVATKIPAPSYQENPQHSLQ